MNEPTNAVLLARLDAIDARLAAIAVPVTALPRIEYNAREFAKMLGMSLSTIRRPEYYRGYGGRKRGGRIVFSESARVAAMEGKRP